MPTWWGKSSSKEAKKKTTKESFIDAFHKKFKSPESKSLGRSGCSRRRPSDTVSEKGSQSRSPSPSKHVARCQSLAERPQAQPLPLPGSGRANVIRPESGKSESAKPKQERVSRPSLFLPLPRPACIRHRLDPTDLDGELAVASISSECSIESDDPGDSRQLSPSSETGEMCAMKEVTLFSDDAKSKESAKQLAQEISLLSRLKHPNIVQYYGSESVADKLYIYLEYVSGGSIHKILQEYGKLGESAIRSYTQQILSGLAYLHAKNTVHRDIKGANILVDPNGRVKLADFGMAKHITGQSCPLSFKGSPYWMAPEVIRNSSGCSLAVDIWSLGCTVLEMATSKPPWSQYEGVAAMFKIGNSKELPTIPDHLSDEGREFVMLCLQRNPHQRPTAAQLLEHSFVKSAAPLEKNIWSPSSDHPALTNAVKTVGTGHARNLQPSDTDGLAIHSSRVSKSKFHSSDIYIPRNISCPVSPVGSPLLRPMSPQNLSGMMSPSPISSPRATSGASTPLTGGIGTVPFHNQFMSSQEGNFANLSKQPRSPRANSPSYWDPDILRGLHPPGLVDRVSRQLVKDPLKSGPSFDLTSPTHPLT